MTNLKDRVEENLTLEGKTIPELCRELGIDNEYKMMRVIADLEQEDKVFLSDFDRIYREDGGAIYIAKYSRRRGNL